MKPSPNDTAPNPINNAAAQARFRDQATGIGQTLTASRVTGSARSHAIKTGAEWPKQHACYQGPVK